MISRLAMLPLKLYFICASCKGIIFKQIRLYGAQCECINSLKTRPFSHTFANVIWNKVSSHTWTSISKNMWKIASMNCIFMSVDHQASQTRMINTNTLFLQCMCVFFFTTQTWLIRDSKREAMKKNSLNLFTIYSMCSLSVERSQNWSQKKINW